MTYTCFGDILKEIAQAIRPPERLTVSEAAAKYRVLSNDITAGPWDNTVAPYLVEIMDTMESLDFTGLSFVGPARCGKALALDTPIPTPSGFSTMGALRVGDEVFGADGRACKVTAKSEVFLDHDCYRVTFADGQSIVADAGHKWKVIDSANQNQERVVTTEYMFGRTQYRAKKRNRFFVPNPKPLQFEKRKLPLDPYIFGLWLGDGHNIAHHLASSAQDVDEMRRNIRSRGYPCRHSVSDYGKHTIYLSEKTEYYGRAGGGNCVSKPLREMGMMDGKRKVVPEEYIISDEEDRMLLLQGLFDTDGCCGTNGRIEFCNVEVSIVSAVRRILWSLGIEHGCLLKKTIGRDAYRITFSPGAAKRWFKLKRKQERLRDLSERTLVSMERRPIVSIEKVATVPTQCITVDSPDHLFVAGECCVVTHNSEPFFNWLVYSAKCDPADMMFIGMTQSVARDWSQGDMRKAIRQSPALKETIIPGKNNINTEVVRFKSGMRLLVKWPSITELSGKTLRRVWLADYDRMDMNVEGQGAPWPLAKKRTQTARRRGMTVGEGSPGFEVLDPHHVPRTPHEAPPTIGLLSVYNTGDRRRWYVPCAQCDEFFEPDFDKLDWPKDENLSIAEKAAGAMMVCPSCGFPHTHDADPRAEPTPQPGKYGLNLKGRWLKDGQSIDRFGKITGRGEESETASFWLKGPAAAFVTWRELVQRYLEAWREYERTGDHETLKAVVNIDLGLPFLPPSLNSERTPEALMSRSVGNDWGDSDEPHVPHGTRFLTAAIDVQDSPGRFIVQVHGHGVGGDIYVVDRFTLKKAPRVDKEGHPYPLKPGAYIEDWQVIIDQVLNRSYPLMDGSGRRMSIHMTVCDSAGAKGVTARAYEFFRLLRKEYPNTLFSRFRLLKGMPNVDTERAKIIYPDSQRKDRNAGARGDIPVIAFNVNALKTQLDGLLDRTDPNGGMIHFASHLKPWFYAELCAEVYDPKTRRWENKKNLRNESTDLLAYTIGLRVLPQFGAIERLQWDDEGKLPPWARDWDDNPLVVAADAGDPFVEKVDEDPMEALKKLAKSMG